MRLINNKNYTNLIIIPDLRCVISTYALKPVPMGPLAGDLKSAPRRLQPVANGYQYPVVAPMIASALWLPKWLPVPNGCPDGCPDGCQCLMVAPMVAPMVASA